MRLFPPAAYFQRTAALPPSAPLREGLTEQWPSERWSNIGCTQECPLDPAVAGAPRLQPGASLPQKKLRDSVASVFQGPWKVTTHIWHQASFPVTLFQHQQTWLFSRVTQALPLGDPHSLYQVSSQQWSHLSLKNPGLHSAPGDLPFPPEHY